MKGHMYFTTNRLWLLFWRVVCIRCMDRHVTQQHIWSSNRCTF